VLKLKMKNMGLRRRARYGFVYTNSQKRGFCLVRINPKTFTI